eukprot:1161093-Pelagomonas_calceolata.AAC.8
MLSAMCVVATCVAGHVVGNLCSKPCCCNVRSRPCCLVSLACLPTGMNCKSVRLGIHPDACALDLCQMRKLSQSILCHASNDEARSIHEALCMKLSQSCHALNDEAHSIHLVPRDAVLCWHTCSSLLAFSQHSSGSANSDNELRTLARNEVVRAHLLFLAGSTRTCQWSSKQW